MYNFHLNNKKMIKLDSDHILCEWSSYIKNNKNDIYLNGASSNDFKMLIRIIELFMNSISESDFRRKLNILFQLADQSEIKKSIELMKELKITPPQEITVIYKLGDDKTLADIIEPIYEGAAMFQNMLFGNKILTNDEKLMTLLTTNSVMY